MDIKKGDICMLDLNGNGRHWVQVVITNVTKPNKWNDKTVYWYTKNSSAPQPANIAQRLLVVQDRTLRMPPGRYDALEIYGLKDGIERFDCSGVTTRQFLCVGTPLESLVGCPDVTHEFICQNNVNLHSLVGGPKRVNWNYDCSGTPLHSLDGCPEYVGDDCTLTLAKPVTWQVMPLHVGGMLKVQYTEWGASSYKVLLPVSRLGQMSVTTGNEEDELVEAEPGGIFRTKLDMLYSDYKFYAELA